MLILAIIPCANSCFLGSILISLILQTPDDSCFVQVMRAAHVIKGAASNLMCGELRKCSTELETASNTASKENKDHKDEEIMKSLKEKFEALEKAVKNYHEYLEKVDV